MYSCFVYLYQYTKNIFAESVKGKYDNFKFLKLYLYDSQL